jgi:hypothetical protein
MRRFAALPSYLHAFGIEARIVAGSSREARLQLDDPSAVGAARRTLRTAGLVARRVAADLLQVRPDAESEEDDDFTTLISSWKEFLAKGSQLGYRKARRLGRMADSARDRIDVLEAARQIAATSWETGTSLRSPGLHRFARLLRREIRRARRTGDSSRVFACMQFLAGSTDPDEMTLEEPVAEAAVRVDNEDDRETTNRTARRARRRRAGRFDDLKNQAFDYAQEYVRENALDLDAVRELATRPGDVFDTWRLSVHELDDSDAAVIWKAAVQDLAATLEAQDEAGSPLSLGPENGIGRFGGRNRRSPTAILFGPTSDIRVAKTKRDLTRETEQLIEYYASRKHPESLTRADVVRFAREVDCEFPVSRLYKSLQWMLEKGIPSRDGEDDE